MAKHKHRGVPTISSSQIGHNSETLFDCDGPATLMLASRSPAPDKSTDPLADDELPSESVLVLSLGANGLTARFPAAPPPAPAAGDSLGPAGDDDAAAAVTTAGRMPLPLPRIRPPPILRPDIISPGVGVRGRASGGTLVVVKGATAGR
jgi:hypothetical protein